MDNDRTTMESLAAKLEAFGASLPEAEQALLSDVLAVASSGGDEVSGFEAGAADAAGAGGATVGSFMNLFAEVTLRQAVALRENGKRGWYPPRHRSGGGAS